jgi:hypothetical protein
LRFCPSVRSLCGIAIVTSLSSPAFAQVPYDKIEIGTTLDATGIALGMFSKPIPLPEGKWSVVGKREESLPLSGGHSDSPSSTPRVSLTLRNTDRQDSPLFAMVVSFTPNSIPINWGNGKCLANGPLGLADDFGMKPDAMLYVCARAEAGYNFRQTVITANESVSPWIRNFMPALIPFASEIPTNVVLADVYGNKFRGKSMGITFLLRADANADVNQAYRSHLTTWMNAAGLSWAKVLNNDATKLDGPATYWASK